MSLYNRNKAVEYANKWWNGYNPRFRHFEVDCTNYISQCLLAGGAPMSFGNKTSGWWYKGYGSYNDSWSYSWAVAHSLKWFLTTNKNGLTANNVNSPNDLSIGDIICYDFDGDGKWQHNTIVTAINQQGLPLVNAHTVNSKQRLWDYKDSHAWTEKIKYSFFHISY